MCISTRDSLRLATATAKDKTLPQKDCVYTFHIRIMPKDIFSPALILELTYWHVIELHDLTPPPLAAASTKAVDIFISVP